MADDGNQTDNARVAADVHNATQALKQNDWQAALLALAFPVAFDPFDAAALALADRALAQAGELAKDFLGNAKALPYPGGAALRIRDQHRRGDVAGAFSALTDITKNEPQCLFIEAWGLDWVTAS